MRALAFGLWLGLSAPLFAAGAARANPRESGVVGSRSAALGGALSADGDDCSSVYYNAALLPAAPSSLCVDAAMLGESSDPEGAASDATSHTLGIGIGSHGTLGGLPFGIGVLLVLPEARLSRVRSVRADEEIWILRHNRSDVAFGAFGVGLEPLPWLSLGAALHVLATLRGGFTVAGDAVQPDASGNTVYSSDLRHSVDASLDSVRSYSLGVGVRPNDALTLALVYRESAAIEQRITGRLEGNVVFGEVPIPARYDVVTVSTQASYPRALVLGARQRVLPTLSVFAELAWEDFSNWKNPEGDTASTLELDLPPDVTLDLPEPVDTPPAHAGQHDRFVPRLGVEFRALERRRLSLDLRAGYAFERSPLPAQSETRWLDTDRHLVALGAGGRLGFGASAVRLDVHVSAAVRPERLAVRAEAPGEREVRASGTALGLGAGVALEF